MLKKLTLLAALLVGPLGCSSDTCTAMGCSSFAAVKGDLPQPNGTVTVTGCLNQVCSVLQDAAPEGCQRVNTTPELHVCFLAETPLRIDVAIYHDPSLAPLADGDVYELEVRDSAGATLVDFTGSATYREHRPNGDGCDPVCKTAELSL